jgi:hypothetical protein
MSGTVKVRHESRQSRAAREEAVTFCAGAGQVLTTGIRQNPINAGKPQCESWRTLMDLKKALTFCAIAWPTLTTSTGLCPSHRCKDDKPRSERADGGLWAPLIVFQWFSVGVTILQESHRVSCCVNSCSYVIIDHSRELRSASLRKTRSQGSRNTGRSDRKKGSDRPAEESQ